MRLPSALAIILATVSQASAQPREQFDLQCHGTMTTPNQKGDITVPSNPHYRVDLHAKRWCMAACDNLHPVITADENELVLYDSPPNAMGAEIRLTINRRNGAFHQSLRSHGFTSVWDGHCEPGVFSGFPEVKF